MAVKAPIERSDVGGRLLRGARSAGEAEEVGEREAQVTAAGTDKQGREPIAEERKPKTEDRTYNGSAGGTSSSPLAWGCPAVLAPPSETLEGATAVRVCGATRPSFYGFVPGISRCAARPSSR